MLSADQYQLLDFGEGRKLERFGGVVLDRPSPAADGRAKRSPEIWGTANACYERTSGDRGVWSVRGELPQPWSIAAQTFHLDLKLTEFGHLGVFPEQAANWKWLAEQVRAAGGKAKVLNLFAYTGASTLACAAAGADVVHIDAAQNTVNWARGNAEQSGLSQAPIRWIAEDALKFVSRELKRGQRYDAVILDPPSYGHGPKGEVWKLADHLPELLQACAELTAGRLRFLLLTCHTPGVGPDELCEMLRDCFGSEADLDAGEMNLVAADGRQLNSGAFARMLSN